MRDMEIPIGQKFGRLLVLRKDEQRTPDGRVKVVCRCDCGNECSVSLKNLKSGITRSCGCMHREVGSQSVKDMTGLRFGRLLVLERAGTSKARTAMWLCKCDCGETCIVSGSYQRQGYTTSCGCWQKELISKRLKKDLLGERFGRLVVISPSNAPKNRKHGVQWHCRCDCGNGNVIAYADDLLEGNKKSCGCISSKGEFCIAGLLKEMSIEYIRQKTFEGCKDQKLLRFDFYLPKYHTVIEYQGEQHYEPIVVFGGEEGFKMNQRHDQIKRDFCRAHGIDFIEVKYDELAKAKDIIKNSLNIV